MHIIHKKKMNSKYNDKQKKMKTKEKKRIRKRRIRLRVRSKKKIVEGGRDGDTQRDNIIQSKR